jgi:stage V sporulation protein B
MKKVKKLFLNTLLLTGASFFMQTVSVSFNVYLNNKIGSVGIGLFQLIMNVYSMSIVFSCGGVRLASTRLTIDKLAVDSRASAKNIMNCCLKYAFTVSVIIASVLFVSAEFISRNWLSDMRAVQPLRILALCLPFISMSSAIKGYFVAVRTVYKTAAVEGFEQGLKILIVVITLSRMLKKGIEYACIAIVFGMCISEIASFLCLFLLYKTSKTAFKSKTDVKPMQNLMKLLRISVPDAIGSCCRSVLLTIEHLLIPVGFKKAGSSAEQALSVYGIIHGMVFPILLYPSAILVSLSGLLVHEIAECNALNQTKHIEYIIKRVMYISVIYSICVSAVLYSFSHSLSIVIYHKEECAPYLEILSVLIPVMYLDMSVDGILKGLNQQFYSMRYNIIDSALCVVLVYFLLPRFAIKGYIFTLFASEIINFFLSLRRLIVVTKVRVDIIKTIVKPCISAVCSIALIKATIKMTGFLDISSAPSIIFMIVTIIVIYFTSLFIFSSITYKDIKWFKSIFQ